MECPDDAESGRSGIELTGNGLQTTRWVSQEDSHGPQEGHKEDVQGTPLAGSRKAAEILTDAGINMELLPALDAATISGAPKEETD